MIWDPGDIKRRIIDDLDFKAFEVCVNQKNFNGYRNCTND